MQCKGAVIAELDPICKGDCVQGVEQVQAVGELVVKLELQYCCIETWLYELLSLPSREIFFFLCRNMDKSASLMVLHWEGYWHITLKDSGRESLNFRGILLYLKQKIAKHLGNFTFRSLYFKKLSLIRCSSCRLLCPWSCTLSICFIQ